MTFDRWLRLWIVVTGLWILAVGAYGVRFVAAGYDAEPRPVTVGVSLWALGVFVAALVVPPAVILALGFAAGRISKGPGHRR